MGLFGKSRETHSQKGSQPGPKQIQYRKLQLQEMRTHQQLAAQHRNCHEKAISLQLSRVPYKATNQNSNRCPWNYLPQQLHW